MNSTTRNYIDQLTWLRGIAAFFVIVSHTIRATEVAYYPGDKAVSVPLYNYLDLGTFGVLLFFALSGCTLYISNQKKLELKNVGSFYVKRFFRIWPAFAVSVVFYFMFRMVFKEYYVEPQGHWIEGQFLSELTPFGLISQLGLFANFTGASGLLNNAYWSLPVEFQYYLLFPVLVISTRKLGFSGPLFIGLLLYVLPKFIPIVHTQVFTLALSFCGGVSVGFIYSKGVIGLNHASGLALSVVSLMVVALVSKGDLIIPDIIYISNLWNFYTVMAVLLVFLVVHSTFCIPRTLSLVLGRYGDISYSTYLYHNLVISATMLFLLYFKVEGYDRIIWLFISAIIFTFVLAEISFRVVEEPSIKIGRMLARRK